MTCIVGMETEKGVVIGGDSAGVNGWDVELRSDRKVFATGPFVIGFTTSFRMGQILRFNLLDKLKEVASRPFSTPTYELMCTEFVDAVRECLEEGGWRKKSDEREEGGRFLVGYNGRLFRIGSDFQVGIPQKKYTAVGSGSNVALGALHALEINKDMSVLGRVRKALMAAAEFNGAVEEPFTIEYGGTSIEAKEAAYVDAH